MALKIFTISTGAPYNSSYLNLSIFAVREGKVGEPENYMSDLGVLLVYLWALRWDWRLRWGGAGANQHHTPVYAPGCQTSKSQVKP